MVLLPGTLCDAGLWRPQIEYLADLVAPLVGDLTRDDSIAAMARRILQNAPPRFILAGLSMGAIVAFEIMRQSPARVLALALLNTNPYSADAEQIVLWHEEIAQTEGGKFSEVIRDRWVPTLLNPLRGGDEALGSMIRAMAENIGPEAYVRQLKAQMGREDSSLALAGITCPTLIVGGWYDDLCPPSMHIEMAERMPHARLVIIEDCGHLSTLERPEAVNSTLRGWLQEVMGRTREPAIATQGVAHA